MLVCCDTRVEVAVVVKDTVLTRVLLSPVNVAVIIGVFGNEASVWVSVEEIELVKVIVKVPRCVSEWLCVRLGVTVWLHVRKRLGLGVIVTCKEIELREEVWESVKDEQEIDIDWEKDFVGDLQKKEEVHIPRTARSCGGAKEDSPLNGTTDGKVGKDVLLNNAC